MLTGNAPAAALGMRASGQLSGRGKAMRCTCTRREANGAQDAGRVARKRSLRVTNGAQGAALTVVHATCADNRRVEAGPSTCLPMLELPAEGVSCEQNLGSQLPY